MAGLLCGRLQFLPGKKVRSSETVATNDLHRFMHMQPMTYA